MTLSTELALFAFAVAALCAAALIKRWYVKRRDARRRAAVQRELARYKASNVLRDERIFKAMESVRKGRPS